MDVLTLYPDRILHDDSFNCEATRKGTEMRKLLTSENLIGATMLASVVAIGCSDTLGGFCFRAALVMPAAWAGIVDIETATAFVVRQ